MDLNDLERKKERMVAGPTAEKEGKKEMVARTADPDDLERKNERRSLDWQRRRKGRRRWWLGWRILTNPNGK